MDKDRLWLANWIIMWSEELFSESDKKEIIIMRCCWVLNMVALFVILIYSITH